MGEEYGRRNNMAFVIVVFILLVIVLGFNTIY